MNTIVNLLSQNKIKNVLFDMDNTLLDTEEYFRKEMTDVIAKSISEILKKPLDMLEDIPSEIYKLSLVIWKEVGYPMEVDKLTILAVEKYCEINNIVYNQKEIEKKIVKLFSNFYTISPELFPGTLKTLRAFKSNGVKIGIYSHAQHDWTGKKVEKIIEEYKKIYHEKLELSFFTTDITDMKDTLGWQNAGKHLNFELDKTLVIGDSFTSDIYPAIEAGYQYVIYLSHTDEIPQIETKHKMYISKNISTIFDSVYTYPLQP